MMTEHGSHDLPIRLAPEQIPEVKRPMPLLRLGTRVMASEAFVNRIVRAVAPDAELKELRDTGLRAAYAGQRMVALAYPRTGESRVFPLLEGLAPGEALHDRARTIASQIVRDTDLFPEDGTQVVALDPVTLVGTRHTRQGRNPEVAEYLAFVRLQRRVNDLPVFGPGTRAMIAVAGDDSIRSFAHRWRRASPTGYAIEPQAHEEVITAIRAQLAPSAKPHTVVTVDQVRLGYYDGGREYLQPVYRFQATISFTERERRAANRHVFGYVPVGRAPEPLPVLGEHKGQPPAEPPRHHGRDPDDHVAAPRAVPPGDPLVGRYVVRNDTDEWVTSANEFLGGLYEAQNLFGGPIVFTDSQYYWAEPFEFESDKNAFINSVHIALNEVHGNWGLFSTRDNHDDLVSLSSIPADGYGAGGGGSLAYWIIHSCEVIPTQADESTSFDVWWNIFNGLHAALGYRTEMWIDDDVMGPFGFLIGLGVPMVSAWLSEVSSNDSYDDGDTYFDGNRQMKEPMGRASAIAVCGHGDDTANDIEPLGRADCLTEWWFNN